MALPIEQQLPIITAVSFGIQQFLQMLVDPLVSLLISWMKVSKPTGQRLKSDGTLALRGGFADADVKKSILGLVAFFLGWKVTHAFPNLDILASLNATSKPDVFWNPFIMALIISAGTEGSNTVLKIAQYAKDAVKGRAAINAADAIAANGLPNGINPLAVTPNKQLNQAALTEAARNSIDMENSKRHNGAPPRQ